MQQELKQSLQEKDYENASLLAEKLTCEELADVLTEMEKADIPAFCRALEGNLLADALVLVDSDLQEQILKSLRDDELEKVLDEMSVDETVEIIEDMPQELVRRMAETDEILQLLSDRNFSVLRPLIASMNAIDLAEVFNEIRDESELHVLFRILPKDLAAETFVEMDSDVKETLISKLNDKELRAVMDEIFLDDTVDIIEEMPASVVKRLLAQSDSETRAYINEILKYPKDSAGSIMTIEFVSLHPAMTVGDAFERIRKTAIDKETIYTCYVVDETNKLVGLVTAKDLMLAQRSKTIDEIMTENVIYAHTEDDKEEVARMISDYGFLALPVVDRETRLVGIVTVDDAMDVLQSENTEDIAKMAAVTPTDKPYLKTSVWRICLSRLPWLIILLVSSTFSGLIISANENTLNMPIYGIVLTACMPMLMGTGGNAGSQASAMIIRGIAIGEVSFKDTWKVVWKEIRVSVLLGAILSVACFAKVMLVDGLMQMDGGVLVAIVVCVSLFFTILVAKLIGALLPLLAKKCRLDPAVVASPFITTIIDVLSLTLYCAFAIWILGTL
ncbi:MAG: magnesium transporter [Clostridiales bacterium]|nr:magnesium transporter [Clostridiales bacterium]